MTTAKKIRLYPAGQSGVHAASASSTVGFVEITNGGYTALGQSVTMDIIRSGATTTVTSTNPSWVATGTDMVAKYAALVDQTNEIILCTCDLDSGGGSVTALVTKTFQIQMSVTGIYTITAT
jgi:hypothetical protein